jgi:uncharacterized protein (DUF924 family)
MPPKEADEILTFWFDEIDHSRWYKKDPAFDRTLAERFGARLEAAKRGELEAWHETARGTLALIILLDQFSRNIYRDTPASFEADDLALALTLRGMDADFDKELPLEQRSFFYMPLMHAEDLAIQRLCLEKMQQLARAGYGGDKYALAHMALISKYGRFPHRNRILGRKSTPEEEEYLKDPRSGF